MVLTHRLAVVVLVLLLFLACAAPGAAQGEVGSVRIYGVDTSQFPLVHLRVVPEAAGGGVVSGVSKDALRVYEDATDQAVPVESAAAVPAGVQVALVFDASGSMNQPGVTSRPGRPNEKFSRCEEAKQAVAELLLTENWFTNKAKQLDRLIVMVPKGASDFEARPDGNWTPDYVMANNQVVPIDCARQTTYTSLYAMMVDAMARMKQVPGWEGRPKYLLVYSDGVDKTSPTALDNVVNRANELGVKVLTVKLGARTQDAVDVLEYMAKQTGGAFASYAGLESLKPVYALIKANATQYDVAYRSTLNRSGQHSVRVAVQKGASEVRSAEMAFGIRVDPPQVQITDPASPFQVERRSDTPGADPKGIEPREQPISVTVSWPDGHARALESISYIVDAVVVASLPADQAFTWDFSGLASGDHALSVQARDELGLTGQSEPLQTHIEIVIPTPLVVPTPKPPLEERTLSVLTVAALAVAGVALLLVVFVIIRNPSAPKTIGGRIARRVKEVTQDFVPVGRGRGRGSEVTLIPLNEDDTEGSPVRLYRRETHIGRDDEQADLVLRDPTVSGIHATIKNEGGRFRIIDEGARNGTFVNMDPVAAVGRDLHDGDEIQLGAKRLVFRTSRPANGARPTKPVDGETQFYDVLTRSRGADETQTSDDGHR